MDDTAAGCSGFLFLIMIRIDLMISISVPTCPSLKGEGSVYLFAQHRYRILINPGSVGYNVEQLLLMSRHEQFNWATRTQ